MNSYQVWIEDPEKFFPLPCGFYDTVDIKKFDGSEKLRIRAGDAQFGSGTVKEWRLSSKQGVPKSEMSGWGYFIDNTAPSSAQEYGLDDRDFEFW